VSPDRDSGFRQCVVCVDIPRGAATAKRGHQPTVGWSKLKATFLFFDSTTYGTFILEMWSTLLYGNYVVPRRLSIFPSGHFHKIMVSCRQGLRLCDTAFLLKMYLNEDYCARQKCSAYLLIRLHWNSWKTCKDYSTVYYYIKIACSLIPVKPIKHF